MMRIIVCLLFFLLFSISVVWGEEVIVRLPDTITVGEPFAIEMYLSKSVSQPYRVSQFIPVDFFVVPSSNNKGEMEDKTGLMSISVDEIKPIFGDTLKYWATMQREGLFNIQARLSYLIGDSLRRIYFSYNLNVVEESRGGRMTNPVIHKEMTARLKQETESDSNVMLLSDKFDNYAFAKVRESINVLHKKGNLENSDVKREENRPMTVFDTIDFSLDSLNLNDSTDIQIKLDKQSQQIERIKAKEDNTDDQSYTTFADLKKNTFWVQIEMSPYGDLVSFFSKQYKIERPLKVIKDDIAFYYFIGPFTNFDSAFSYSIQLNNKQAINTFPIEINGKNKIRH